MFHSRNVITLCIVILSFVFSVVARNASAQENDPCLRMQSQAEMNDCEAEQYAKVDAELNSVYKQLTSKYKSDPQLVKALKLAQESWLRFRDADLASFYYQKDKLGAYGSVYPTCRSRAVIRLTVERTKELKQMLNPKEGDVCAFAAAPPSAQVDNLAKPAASRSYLRKQ
jgi:uncharacterized protein YecT (DUF1311 family)